ncbi:MAG: hypothetical protein ACFFDP_13535, partial [Promethearchaeota archaeon]
SLEESRQTFMDNGHFNVMFKELIGKATLVFYIRMNWEDQTGDGEYIEVDVNKIAECHLGYYHGNLGYLNYQGEWPQLTIRFRTGLFVKKKMLEENGEHYVHITVSNFRSQPLAWCWVRENPAPNISISEIEDNFEFRPFREIALRYMFEKAKSIFYPRIRWSWRPDFEKYLIRFYRELVVRLAEDLDPYLCRFRSSGGNCGVFKFARDIPPMGTRELSFKVSPASFSKDLNPALLSEPVDTVLEKPSDVSRYRHPETTGALPDVLWEFLEPNPLYTQFSTPNPIPDLRLYTGFRNTIDLFYEILLEIQPLFKEIDIHSEAFSPLIRLLECREITITGLHGEQERFGLSVTVANLGNAPGTASLSLRSIFVPFPDPRLPLDRMFKSPWQCKLDTNPVTVDDGQELTLKLHYSKIMTIDGKEVKITPETLEEFSGWVISTVDIAKARGELRTSNNNAITIVMKLHPRDLPPNR